MNKPKTFPYIAYNETHPLSLGIGFYDNNSLAIYANTWQQGYAEPWGNITVCLPNITPDKDCAFVDVNNNNNIDEWLENNNIATFTGRIEKSGYVSYPEFKFNMELLKELDPDGYENYNK